MTTWDDVFREIARRRIGGGPKVNAAEEVTFAGTLAGRAVVLVSRVKLNNPMESFLTSSGHRLRDSHVGRGGHWVDLRVATEVTDAELAQIQTMAREVDTRHVLVSRGRHPAIAVRPRHYPAA